MPTSTSSFSSSPQKERWMTVDPADLPCPAFGWYVPRFLRPPSSTEAAPGLFSESIPEDLRNLSKSETMKREEEEKERGEGGKAFHSRSTASSFSSSLSSRSFFPSILSSLLSASLREKGASSPPLSSSSPPSSSSSPAEQVEHIVQEMEREVSTIGENYPHVLSQAMLPPEAKKMAKKSPRRRSSGEEEHAGRDDTFVWGDWEKVTPLHVMWNAPPLSSKVPPATDFARLLARCTANSTTNDPDE